MKLLRSVRNLARGARHKRVVNIKEVPDKYKPLVKKIIAGSPIWGSHQTITFPDGFVLKGGRDESRIDMLDLPKDLSGASVLDIGCNIGAISLECKQRNATRVVGLDYKPNLVECAREIAQVFGYDIEYRVFDLFKDTLEEKFDYVFLLNVFHHLDEKTRLQVLRMVDAVTLKKFYFEAPSEGDIVARDSRSFSVEDYLGYLRGFTRFPNIVVTGQTDFNRPFITCSR